MVIDNRKINLFFVLIMLVGYVIVGCTKTTTSELTPLETQTLSSPSPNLSPKLQEWSQILPGEAAYNLEFTANAKLAYQGKILLDSIPVSYSDDGSVTTAKRLIVSSPSPSGNFSFVKACEESTPEFGLCWSVYLINRDRATAQKVAIGKYGGREWVQWSDDEHYAVLVEQSDGANWFVAVDLATGESKLFEEIQSIVYLDNFKWLDQHRFQVQLNDSSSFKGDINVLFDGQ